MDRYHFCTKIFGDMCQLGGIQAAIIPPHPHFYRHWNRHSLNCCLDQTRGQRKVTHQSGTGVAIDNLFYRTAHVDIDNRGTTIFVQLSRLPHFIRGATCQLHGNRLFNRIPFAFLQRLPGFTDHGLAGDHFGNIQTGSEAANNFTEWHIGDTRHRCQNDRTTYFDIADLNGC